MRVAQLSEASGVSVPLIKYYLREGLLPAGRPTARNQAAYSDSHVQRLRVIRALIEVAGLPVAVVRQVLAVMDGESLPLATLAAAQDAVTRPGSLRPEDQAWAGGVLDAAIAQAGWQVPAGTPAYRKALEALVALHQAGADTTLTLLATYTASADRVGRDEVAAIAGIADPATLAAAATVGTILRGPLLDALVMLAQQHWTGRTWGERPEMGSALT